MIMLLLMYGSMALMLNTIFYYYLSFMMWMTIEGAASFRHYVHAEVPVSSCVDGRVSHLSVHT